MFEHGLRISVFSNEQLNNMHTHTNNAPQPKEDYFLLQTTVVAVATAILINQGEHAERRTSEQRKRERGIFLLSFALRERQESTPLLEEFVWIGLVLFIYKKN